jgi:flagella basal body P-ring formation protein FlgA
MQDALNNSSKRLKAQQQKSHLRGHAFSAVHAIVLMLLVVLAAPANPQACAASKDQEAGNDVNVLRLYPKAVVTASRVHLKDVARLEGPLAAQAGEWSILLTPKPGQNRTLTLEDLQKAFAEKDVNLSRWVFRGSSQCEVSHPAKINENGEKQSSGQTSTILKRDAVADQRETLKDCLQALITRPISSYPGTPVIRFPQKIKDALHLKRGIYRFEIEKRSRRDLGDLAFKVTVWEGDDVKQVLHVLAHVSLKVKTMQAARPINRGETIGEDNVSITEQTVDNLTDMGITNPKAVMGQRTKRFIDRGQLIEKRYLEPVPMVNRNDLVTVWVRCGQAVIKATATACESGSYGDTIQLKRGISRDTFSAKVIADKTVEIVAPGSKRMVAASAKGGH